MLTTMSGVGNYPIVQLPHRLSYSSLDSTLFSGCIKTAMADVMGSVRNVKALGRNLKVRYVAGQTGVLCGRDRMGTGILGRPFRTRIRAM